MANIYEEHGFKSRAEYLRNLAEEYGADLEHVVALADLLGPNEDFDGLVTAIQDMEYMG